MADDVDPIDEAAAALVDSTARALFLREYAGAEAAWNAADDFGKKEWRDRARVALAEVRAFLDALHGDLP